MLRIATVIGSTRPGRKAEAVAKWVYEIAQNRSDVEVELVGIKDFLEIQAVEAAELLRFDLAGFYRRGRKS